MDKQIKLRLTKLEHQRLLDLHGYIPGHLHEKLTVNTLAQKTGLYPQKLNAAFQLLFGTELRRYLLDTRMQKARTLLEQTDRPIKEIGASCGYTSNAAFHRAFRAYFDQTPDDVRRQF